MDDKGLLFLQILQMKCFVLLLILQVIETIEFPFNDPIYHKLKVAALEITVIIHYIRAASNCSKLIMNFFTS
jgi:hypothetical protein